MISPPFTNNYQMAAQHCLLSLQVSATVQRGDHESNL